MNFVFVIFNIDICANLIQIEPGKWSTQSYGGSGRKVLFGSSDVSM
jgi:hypothetical protein